MHNLKFLLFFVLLLISSCANLQPYEDLQIKLIAIDSGKQQGMSPSFTLKLLVTNPNAVDFEIDGLSFKLDIADQQILSGVANNVPTLLAYSDTVVAVQASISFFNLLKFLAFVSTDTEQVLNYHLRTKIDPKGFMVFNIEHQGKLDQNLLSGFTNPQN